MATMSKESKHGKHLSAGYPSAAAAIPRPPPLPAPRPLQRARDAASRFLGYPSRPTSPGYERDDDRFSLNSNQFTRSASLGATQNATASHRTGLEIKTVSINDTGTHAIIAGKEIFKTVKIEDGWWAEDFNLRTAIRSTPNHASGKPRNIYSIDIADVAWAKGDSGNYIAAATSSGKIILYDLGHAGLQAAQLHEHFRQVHNITFNPHKGSLLLSGSLDGTVRLWDVRDVRSQANAIQSKRKFSGQSDGVRDVKWSPTDGVDFAFGTDNGEIQRWDMRNLKSAKVRIPAHSLSCNTIDWHPDGKHIVSAGSDKTLRVFDVSLSRPRKALWEIKTPYPAMNARWRPSSRSAMPNDNGARLCAQIVTAYDRDNPVMHIWDFRRPLLPFRELQPYASAPTDLLWHSQDLLWTVGREGTLLQTDIQHSSKVIDRYNLQAFDVSPLGEVSIVSQDRKVRRVPKQQHIPSFSHGSSGSSPDKNYGLSRSWADDSIDHTFLSSLQPKRQNRASSGSRAHAASAASTSTPNQTATLKLDEILLNRKSYRPQQIACRGLLPGHNSHQYIAYMASRCKMSLGTASNDEDMRHIAREAFQSNADHALSAGFWSLAQTLKIVGLMTDNHLRDRSALKRKRASAKVPQQVDEALVDLTTSMDGLSRTIAGRHAKSEAQSPNSLRPVSTIAKQLALPESTSNVPTPIARASSPSRESQSKHHVQLPDFDKDDGLTLPPSLTTTSETPPKHDDTQDRRLTISNLTDHVKSQIGGEASHRRERMDQWSTQHKGPLGIDPGTRHGMQIPTARSEKHDSAESFQFLEDSGGSRAPSFPASLESSDYRMVAERPSRRRPPPTSHPQNDDLSTAHQSMFFEGSGTLGHSGVRTMESSAHLDMSPMDDEQGEVSTDDQKTAGFPFEQAYMSDLPASQPASPTAPIPIQKAPLAPSYLDNGVSPTGHAALPAPEVEVRRSHSSKPFSPEQHEHIQHPSPKHVFTEADMEIEQGHAVWTLVEMLHQLLDHYTISQPYPQVAAQLILLLGPLLPRTNPLAFPEINSTTAHYADYFLSSLNFDPDSLPHLIQTSFFHTLKSGLQPLQIEAILSTYHDQLLAHQLFDAAASLRRIAYPAYPAVYEDFLKDNTVLVKCGHCNKPMTGDVASLRCEFCLRKQDPCAFCSMPTSPFGQSKVFSACLLCGHGGHATCLEEWFLMTGGDGCLTEGCLCDCVAGAWREAKLSFGENVKDGEKRTEVKRDEWKAKESRAVVGARSQLVVRETA